MPDPDPSRSPPEPEGAREPTPPKGQPADSEHAKARSQSRSGPLMAEEHGGLTTIRRAILGAPRDLRDRSLFRHLALIPLLAWVGLGADALSSSAYGPEEAYRHIQGHTYLAVALAVATALTVLLISSAYSRIIENFPNGGGYGVATRLLGEKAGLVSGSALMVDYVLTITISVAAAGKALFSFLPPEWAVWKLHSEVGMIVLLSVLNLRGVKESILVLAPLFMLFLVTHVVLIGAGIVLHAPEVGAVSNEVAQGFQQGLQTIGIGGMLLLFLHAYSLGGGTYTGIEAVSNALPLMREPQVQTAKRTMVYLAISLSLCAGGLLLCYLLWHVVPVPGKSLNAVLAEAVAAHFPYGSAFVVVTLASEAILLLVAAQAGFMGGPRVLANMAVDSWMPHRFSSLSERLTTENGIIIMAAAALGFLLWTGGRVEVIVVMYSINVFLTFSLTMAGMVRYWWMSKERAVRTRRLVLFVSCFLLCATILVVTVIEKTINAHPGEGSGGYITIAVTSALILACWLCRRHYRAVSARAAKLYAQFGDLPLSDKPALDPEPSQPTAVILVGTYGALGIHTLLNAFRVFPGHFHGVVFLSVAVMDTGTFKGDDTIEALRARSRETLEKYVRLATGLGLPATYRLSVGTDAVDESEALCLKVAKEFPRAVFFAGKLIFQHERWYHRMLHNNTAFALQKRLHWAGKAMVVMPARMQ